MYVHNCIDRTHAGTTSTNFFFRETFGDAPEQNSYTDRR